MKLYAVFSRRPEVTASITSPNIYHCVYGLHFNCGLQQIFLNKHFVYIYLLTVFYELSFWLWPKEVQKNLYMAPCSKCLATPDLEKL